MSAVGPAEGSAANGRVEVRVLDTPGQVARAAAEEVRRSLAAAIEAHGVARWVLAGGSTPDRLYDLLAATPETVDWPRVQIFWGDERAVPADHPESNFGRVRARLLDRLPTAAGAVHRMHGELPPQRAADEYEALLRDVAAADPSADSGPPRLDLVLLGLGADAHTASLFPGAAPEAGRWVAATRAPSPPRERITLTPTVFNCAARVVFLATGAAKAAAVARVLALRGDQPALPATWVRPRDGKTLWLVDRAAAAELARRREAAGRPARSGGADGAAPGLD